MRVLHITNDYFNSKVYSTLHQGLLNLGVDSKVFVPMGKQDPQYGLEGIREAHCFGKYDRFFYMNKQRKVYRSLRPVLRADQPELLHGYFLFSAGISCLWAKREYGIPYVITVQNTDINAIYRYFVHLRGLAWEILREASMVFFVSNAYRQFALERMVPQQEREKAADKFRLVPFAIDPFWAENQYRREPGLPADRPLKVITVGMVNRSKNQQTAARAVKRLRCQGQDVTLTVVGQAQDKKVEEALKGKPFLRRVYQLPKEELVEEYRQADLFLLPSLTESFGLVYAEALTQGLPVLYTAGQGFDQQFPEGYVGYRVDGGSEEDIADKILQVVREYPELQKNCLTASETFTREAVCEKVISLYEEVLRDTRKETVE